MVVGCISVDAKKSIVKTMKKIGIPREIREAIEEIIQSFPDCKKTKTKKKRAPSAYNMFIKECLLNIKNEGAFKNVPHQDRFSECVKRWKERK